jgi:HEAT repeat protein
MYKDPDLPMPRVELVFPKRATALWLKALEQPDAEMKCRAAATIALAHRRGMKGLQTTIAPLRAALDQRDQHPAVVLEVARALIVLDARKEASPSLLRWVQAGEAPPALRDLVEPALARWDYRPARVVWLERLRQGTNPHRSLVLAMQGLAAVKEARAVEPLRDRAHSGKEPAAIRLEAARALGALAESGLEKDAARLAAEAGPRGLVGRLAAAEVLRRHKGPEAVRLLQGLARDREPTVAALALARLIEIDPRLALPALAGSLASPDAKVRTLAVQVLFRLPDARHLRLLGDRLDDQNPEVRVLARRSLRQLAQKKELRSPVIAEGMRLLAKGQWRGLEQAAILLARLDHKPAANRLVELLEDDRPEVFVTAAWGLRQLAVGATLPEVLAYVEAEHKRLKGRTERDRKGISRELVDHQLSQLNQFLGRQKYSPASAVLQRFIPRGQAGLLESRAAAIWALGLIHEGKPVASVATALQRRLQDLSVMPPEDIRVAWMSAIALGRMKAKAILPTLRKYYFAKEPTSDPVNNACGWAIEQITGEAVPAPRTIRQRVIDWFLTPRGAPDP